MVNAGVRLTPDSSLARRVLEVRVLPLQFKNLFRICQGIGIITLSEFNLCYIIMLRFLTENNDFIYRFNQAICDH